MAKKICKIHFGTIQVPPRMNKHFRNFSLSNPRFYPRIIKRSNNELFNEMNAGKEGKKVLNISNEIIDERAASKTSGKIVRLKSNHEKIQNHSVGSVEQVFKQKGSSRMEANYSNDGKPIFTEKTWKSLKESRVAFNLKKLKTLSGMEKLELLRCKFCCLSFKRILIHSK